MKASDTPAILVLGAGLEAYRSDALRSIAATAPVVLLDPSPPSWVHPLTTTQIATDLTNHGRPADADQVPGPDHQTVG